MLMDCHSGGLDGLRLAATRANHIVYQASSADEGIASARNYDCDAIVIGCEHFDDEQLALVDIIRRIRPQTTVVVAAQSASPSAVSRGFACGADDIIVGTVGSLVALARVIVAVRLAHGHHSSTINVGPLSINVSTQRCSAVGQPIHLTASEYRLVEALALRRDQTVTRSRLLELLYGPFDEPFPKAVDLFVHNIRQKLITLIPFPLIHTWNHSFVLRDCAETIDFSAISSDDSIPCDVLPKQPLPILLVMGEPAKGDDLAEILVGGGFRVQRAVNGSSGIAMAAAVKFGLVIVDRELSDMRGEVALAGMSSDAATMASIVINTDPSDPECLALYERVDALINERWDAGIVIALVRSLLKRSEGRQRRKIEFGGLIVDLSAKTVRVGARIVDLTAKEFEVLEALLRQPGHVATRDALLEFLYPTGPRAMTATIDRFVHRLRKKLRLAGCSAVINTSHGAGFSLAATQA